MKILFFAVIFGIEAFGGICFTDLVLDRIIDGFRDIADVEPLHRAKSTLCKRHRISPGLYDFDFYIPAFMSWVFM